MDKKRIGDAITKALDVVTLSECFEIVQDCNPEQ